MRFWIKLKQLFPSSLKIRISVSSTSYTRFMLHLHGDIKWNISESEPFETQKLVLLLVIQKKNKCEILKPRNYWYWEHFSIKLITKEFWFQASKISEDDQNRFKFFVVLEKIRKKYGASPLINSSPQLVCLQSPNGFH